MKEVKQLKMLVSEYLLIMAPPTTSTNSPFNQEQQIRHPESFRCLGLSSDGWCYKWMDWIGLDWIGHISV